ncbi:MAG: hypothetical protein RR073_03415 [Clostridia bacterium]
MKIDMVKQTLANITEQNKVANGYIFYSDIEELSRMAARYFAKCICCSEEKVPCDVCSSCIKIEKDINPDVITINKPKTRASISVDTIRGIIAGVNIKPNESTHKIYILEDAECLTVSAQNALLKILEEPPANVHFILCSKNEGAILQTVKSRCQKMLITNNESLARAEETPFIKAFLTALRGESKYDFQIIAQKLNKDRAKNIIAFEKLLNYFSDILAIKNNVIADEKSEIIKNITNKTISNLIENTLKLLNQLKQNCNVALATNAYFISCWEEIH